MPRPPKITEDHVQQAREAMRLGLTIEAAGHYIGISGRTFHRWLRRGEMEPDSIFGRFCQAVKRGEAQSAAVELARIRQASRDGDWKASAWILERRHGYTRSLSIRGQIETVDAQIETVEDYQNLLDRVVRAGQIASAAAGSLIVHEEE